MLRYGILSTSSIAPRFIDAVRTAGAGEAVALSSRSLQKAEELAKLWNIPKAYGSHDDLLDDPEVDIVYISTVNSQHYPWAKAALLKGKHVVCEKPCTTSSEQTQELFALAREKGLFLMEAEKMFFLPAVLALRSRIADGLLGDVYMAQMSHSFPATYNDWMFDPEAGGGPLLSSGIYAVHLMIYLFGGIKSIRGTKSALENGVEWQYILSGETDTGVLFTAQNSTRVTLDNTCRIYGTKGWAELPQYWKAQKVIFHIDGKEQVFDFSFRNEMVYEAEHIAICLENDHRSSHIVTEGISVKGIEALEKVKENW